MSKADKAIGLLDDLIKQLDYFYGNSPKFKESVLKPATEIENTLKELAVNKKETFKRIAKRYENRFKKQQEALDIIGIDVDSIIDERDRDKDRRNPNKDSE